MILSLQLFVSVFACSALSVIGQTPQTGLNFTGPGYIACEITQYVSAPCNQTGDFSCTEADIGACNVTLDNGGGFSEDALTIYLNLFCDCVIYYNCPDSCEYNEGDYPRITSTAVNDANFTGPGIVSCPVADLVDEIPATCDPYVYDETLCGNCNTTLADLDSGFVPGDESLSIPIPCMCQAMTNCPNTCSFELTEEVALAPTDSAPVAAPIATVPTDSAPVAAPIADVPTDATTPSVTPVTAAAPMMGPTADVTATTQPSVAPAMNGTAMTPTAPNATVPSAPVRAPVASPTRPSSSNTNSTSSAHHESGRYYMTLVGVMTMMTSLVLL